MTLEYVSKMSPGWRSQITNTDLTFQVDIPFSVRDAVYGAYTDVDPLEVQDDITIGVLAPDDMAPDPGIGTWYGYSDFSGETPLAAIPTEVWLEYDGETIWGNAFSTTVHCRLVRREIRTTSTSEVVEMTAVYRGRPLCSISMNIRSQLSSHMLQHDLEEIVDEPGKMRAIGPNREGAPTRRPGVEVQVTAIEEWDYLNDYLASYSHMAGSVNEADWVAPWVRPVDDGGTPYSEGEWMYMGLLRVVPDRDTQTLAVTHGWVKESWRNSMERWPWFEIMQQGNDVNNGRAVGRWVTGKKYTPKVAPIAGTDYWVWDEGENVIPPFSDLALTPVVVTPDPENE